MTGYRRSRNVLIDPVRVAILLEGPTRSKLARTVEALPDANKSTIMQWLIESMEVDEYGIPLAWPSRPQLIEEMRKDSA